MSTQTLAAVDLGSNSFHLVMAQLVDGELRVLDRLKETVRLAEGLSTEGDLRDEVAARALAALSRFGQRLEGMPSSQVRIVGTNTLRRINDRGRFLRAAGKAVGFPIATISGNEEARLIFQAVDHALGSGEGRLVIDIGGGSTEFIIGEFGQPQRLASLQLGCVAFSQRFFPEGELKAKALKAASLTAQDELLSIRRDYQQLGWQQVVGSSGSVRAIADVLEQDYGGNGSITAASLQALYDDLAAVGNSAKLKYKGLNADRRPVFAAGVVILHEAFQALGIAELVPSSAALREGLLLDIQRRLAQEDRRESALLALAKRFSVDVRHGQLVAETAKVAFDAVAADWQLAAADRDLLVWASLVHEIGIALTHGGYHKHGAYLLEHCDLAGFTRQEQRELAALVLAHRKRLTSERFTELCGEALERCQQLAYLLRLAVLLHRTRQDDDSGVQYWQASEAKLKLVFANDWLASRPLTQNDLLTEQQRLAECGFELQFQG